MQKSSEHFRVTNEKAEVHIGKDVLILFQNYNIEKKYFLTSTCSVAGDMPHAGYHMQIKKHDRWLCTQSNQ